MNKYQKIIKIIAISLAIFIIVNIFSFIVYLFSIVGNFAGINNNNSREENITNIYENIEKINVGVNSSKITIKKGDEFKVITKGFKNKLMSNQVNQTLEVYDLNGQFRPNKKYSEVIIYVNDDTLLKSIIINSGAGNVLIDNVTSDKLYLSQGVGILEIRNSVFLKSEINGGAGEIKISNSKLKDLDFEAGVGSVHIEAEITGDSEINNGIGKMTLLLLGKESNYRLKVEKGIGSIKINNKPQQNDSIYGSGINKVEIDGGIGSININFESID